MLTWIGSTTVARVSSATRSLERLFGLPGGAQDRERAAVSPGPVDLPPERLMGGRESITRLASTPTSSGCSAFCASVLAIIARPKASRSW